MEDLIVETTRSLEGRNSLNVHSELLVWSRELSMTHGVGYIREEMLNVV
jgi:hypothetical protein